MRNLNSRLRPIAYGKGVVNRKPTEGSEWTPCGSSDRPPTVLPGSSFDQDYFAADIRWWFEAKCLRRLRSIDKWVQPPCTPRRDSSPQWERDGISLKPSLRGISRCALSRSGGGARGRRRSRSNQTPSDMTDAATSRAAL